MPKSSFLPALCRDLDSRGSHLSEAAQEGRSHPSKPKSSRQMSATAGPAKGGVTVEQHEVEPPAELDLAACSLFTAYGVNPALSTWFKQNCAARVRLSTKHEICLGECDDEGPNCAICQDTTAGCFLYITLPCCHQVVGDECLLSWFIGGEISRGKGRGSKKLASTTCPCCRAVLLPRPVVVHASWEDEQEARALAAIIEESRAWIVDRPPPPRVGSSSPRVKREGKRRRRGILEALHLRRRASVRRGSQLLDADVSRG
ncbi:hypothetical protein EJ03DRAFT_385271 [Teratosphaeria nubilosa]|uniref:RING-type domain-containing protein n=1 Tax=Teratosphaeria nubilosa TaxID=161662 RepID=A0A6G1KY40_9PEZI|nr:hypothetical protein EJ03DRAFT_385271 [Teratosphaeria nubilosa]